MVKELCRAMLSAVCAVRAGQAPRHWKGGDVRRDLVRAAALAGVLFLTFPVSLAAEGLKIAAWNMEHLMAETDAGCKPRDAADYARVRHYADELDADVVAFQEVENAAAARRVFDPDVYAIEISRREAGPRGECWRRPGQRYGPLRTGFAIRHDVSYVRHADVYEPDIGGRHAVDIAVALDGETLRLLSVHLRSGCHTNEHDARDKPACEVLHEQVGLVGAWLDARTREGQSAIALGDFNRRFTLQDDRLWAGINDVAPADYTALTEGHSQVCLGPYEDMPYIDHIIVNPQARRYVASDLLPLAYEETGEAAPSDHCPIAVRLRAR